MRIREAIDELERWTINFSFQLFLHDELNRKTYLVNNFKDLFTDLGDYQSLLSSLKGNEFFQNFEQKGLLYEQQMVDLDEYLHCLYQIQRRWLYLEPIFSRGALPEKQELFKSIDSDFISIMKKIQINSRVFTLHNKKEYPLLKERLEKMVVDLENCQKALSDFLERKRELMPRFYFIGDDDLLEIIGQAQNPAVVQAHLKKLFQGIHTVDFSVNNDEIVSMNSMNSERVALKHTILIKDTVEKWLNDLSDEMVLTLNELLLESLKSDEKLDYFPSQVNLKNIV